MMLPFRNLWASLPFSGALQSSTREKPSKNRIGLSLGMLLAMSLPVTALAAESLWSGDYTAADSIGANDGTWTEINVNRNRFDSYVSDGVAGGAFRFEHAEIPATGYVSVPYDPSLDISNGFTVSFWFRTNLNEVGNGFREPTMPASNWFMGQAGSWLAVMLGNDGSNGCGFNTPGSTKAQVDAWFKCVGHVRFGFPGVGTVVSGTCDARQASCKTYDDGEWHHVVGVYNNTSGVATLYVDGVLKDSKALAAPNLTAAPIDIGRYVANGQTRLGRGDMDEVRLITEPLNAEEILALFEEGASVPDADNDGVEDAADNCPNNSNPSQSDADGDGIGDACEADTDSDGLIDDLDNCALTANPNQLDTDVDGEGDACDADDDGDGTNDASDNCPLTANQNQLDTDSDGKGNACDADDDGDGADDFSDNCPLTANADQIDFDGDQLGDACDSDDDGDGVADGVDSCGTTATASLVNGNGCSIADICDCGTAERHGNYVSCVARAASEFRRDELITKREKSVLVKAAAKSSCGKPAKDGKSKKSDKKSDKRKGKKSKKG